MMNEHKIINSRQLLYMGKLFAITLGVTLFAAPPLYAAEAAKAAPASTPVETVEPSDKPAQSNFATGEIPSYLELSVGQSYSIKLPKNARLQKVTIDNPNVVHVTVTAVSDIVLYGKSAGSTVLILKDKSGQSAVVEVTVQGGTVASLEGKLHQLLPGENIHVYAVASSLVLTGTVTDAVKVSRAVMLAEAYSGKKVINFLQVGAPQQVMLEVKIAEVSKTLTDKLGSGVEYGTGTSGGETYSLIAGFLSGKNGVAGPAAITGISGANSITLDGARASGLVKILAEPTIMAMSGQEGAFLAGGKIFIPVPQSGLGGVTVITLEEKEFGVGLKFTPTVLEGGLINIKVAPEVSEIGGGAEFGSQILPTITTRRASTTVQLKDGQSFAIGGLIKNNVKSGIAAFPGLGEIPILGALFRSSEFQNDKSELMFVVTPRLVKPLPSNYALPTDSYIAPNRADLFLKGKLEGSPNDESQPAAAATGSSKEQAPATESGGVQKK